MHRARPVEPTWTAPEGRGAFGGFIGPRNLVALVEVSAPWLFDGSHRQSEARPRASGARLADLGRDPLGWWTILLAHELLDSALEPTPAQRTDYFALCLAAHFASVATYVPTDVDAKIRHALWLGQTAGDERRRMGELAFQTAAWDVSGVSARSVRVPGHGTVSGHDGERLSVLCGGWIAALAANDASEAARFEDAIDLELAREARAFDALAREEDIDLALVDLATILTHNAGDVMQSLGSKSGRAAESRARERFTDLARERFERYGGAFGRAAALYREISASEGHRHYPLRAIKPLRSHADLLLPLGPFLDDWGARLALWPRFDAADQALVVAGLADGCRRVAGQASYYRALAGFDRAHRGGLAARELAVHWTSATKKALADPELRSKVGVRRESFEASARKRVRAILAR